MRFKIIKISLLCNFFLFLFLLTATFNQISALHVPGHDDTEPLEIILDTSGQSFSGVDTVTINGRIVGYENQLVAIEVKDPSNNAILIRTIQTDSNGDFQLKFKIPSNAMIGNYEIIANAQVEGQSITKTDTIQIMQNGGKPSFGTVPYEVIIPSVVAASAAVGIVLYLKRKKSIQKAVTTKRKFCGGCGATVESTTKFCRKCGKTITKAAR